MSRAVARLGVLGALGGLLALAGPALGARNLVPDHTRVTPGCPGHALTSTTEGFLFGFGEGGGMCSISTPWGTPVATAAQGRLTFTAPPGTRIARWRDLDVEIAGVGPAPVQTELYVRDATGEYQLVDWGTEPGRHVDTHSARHPDGATLMFLLLRNHSRFTPDPGRTRHVNVHDGAIDLWDLEPPSVTSASVDGGAEWSSSPARTVRVAVADNLGDRGLGALRVDAGATTLAERLGPGAGAHGIEIDLGRLADGEHALSVHAVPAGTGDLPVATSPPLVVRLDRTPPPQPEGVDGIAAGWTASPAFRAVGAPDAHSGIVAHEWRVSRDRGATWSAPVRTTAPFAPGGDGAFRVKVRALDGAGHASGWTLALDEARVDRGDPVVELHAPQTLTGDEPIRVVASDATSGVASVQLEYRTPGGASWTPLAAGPGPELASTRRSAGLGEGRYELRATAVDHAGNSGRATGVVTVGAARAETAPTPPSPSGSAPGSAATAARPGAGASPGRVVLDRARSLSLNGRRSVRITAGRGPRVVVRAPLRRRLRLVGRLLDAEGRAVVGSPVIVRLRGKRIATTATGGGGRFRVAAPRGAAGRIDIVVDGRRVGTWNVRIVPRVGVSAARSVQVGRALTLRGRVLPTPRAQGARRHIALLHGVDTRRCPELRHVVAAGHVFARPRPGATRRIRERCWRVVGSGRVDSAGRFRLRFRDFAPLTLRGRPYPGGYRYAAYFQVRVPAGPGWSSQPGRSRVVPVTVRG